MKKTYLLLLCVSSFFVACEKDEIISEQETTLAIEQSIEKINFKDLPSNVSKYFEEKKNLGNLKSKVGNPFGEAKKNQPVIKITNKENVVSYTIALTKNNKANKKGASGLYFDNLVVKEMPDGGEKALVFRYEPDQTWYSNPARSLKIYTGNIKVFGWQGDAMGNMKVVEGKLVKEKNHNKRSTTVECIYELDYIFCVGGGGDFPTETCTYYYKEKCTLTDGGGGGGPGPGAPGGSTGGGGWGDGSNPPTGGGDNGSGDDDGVDTQPIIEEFPDKIDTSELNDCHSNLIETLKTIKNGIVGKMIQKLAGSNSTDYNWDLDYDMPVGSSPNATASTDPVATSNSVKTHINQNRVKNSTDLSMGRTFVHEAVHAFLVYQYRYDSSASDMNYTALLNKYADQYNTNANDTHHILFLKENLIDPIADALQEFGSKLGYNLPPQYYTDMAYGGLYASSITNNIFENLVPNKNDQNRIKNRLSAETDNITINGVSPEGSKACN